MMNKKISLKKIAVASVLMTCSTVSFALKSACTHVDIILAEHLKGIQKLVDIDTLNKNNQIVEAVLTSFSKDTDSLTCDYNRAKEQGLYFLKSADNKFRVYTWNTEQGGTMHDYEGFVQFVDDTGGIQLFSLKPNGGATEDDRLVSHPKAVFTTIVNNKPMYMLVQNAVFSTSYLNQKLTMYQITGSELTKPKLIKTQEDLTNNLKFDFNLFSIIDKQRDSLLFEFDKKRKRIRFPVVIANDKYPYGEVTNRWINYQFNGQYFRKVKR